MNTNSNSYTIAYVSIIVVIVVFLLAFISSSLKPTQDRNIQSNTRKQILAALNIKNMEDADVEYKKYVKGDILMNVDGTLTENMNESVANYEKEAREQQYLYVFVCEVNGQTKYTVPIYGTDLWGAIWGYVALNGDRDTVYGTYFSHASGAPDLNAEIVIEYFQNEFAGKRVLENRAITLGVIKNGKVEKPGYQVDGISGGTITLVGVDTMLKSYLNGCLSLLTK